MLAMAVDMLQAVQDLTVPNGGSVRVRIGMHVGPAYAGWVLVVPKEEQHLGTQLQGWARSSLWMCCCTCSAWCTTQAT